ncbi:glycosyltransferase [Blautia sp. CLA-JM-H16]|uniref:Glycosyltransferase n=1 Tax=Blautia aquisgranensis TaxID=3133153 RepID=A0ABV1BFE1_9FIRM
MRTVKTDVIIPSYHPGEEFGRLLERLNAQKYPINKIIIMNTEEKFWKKEWENKYPLVEVHHLSKEEFDHGATRRKGAELSDAKILVFMTQDALPADRNLIGNLVSALQNNENAGAAYARQLPKEDCRFLEKYTRSFNYPEKSCVKTEKDVETRGIKTYFCSNVCAAYDHSVYEKVGGFPEKAIFNEDMIYAGWMAKKGYAIVYAADARVYHSHNYTCMQQFHRNFDLGVSQAEHPEVFEGVPSEGEGIRLVKKSMAYLVRTGHIWMIPGLFFQSAAKYAGYFLGKRYRKLPENLILACTMSPYYWKKRQ